MAVLLTDSLSTADYKEFLRTVSNLRWRTKISMVSEISCTSYLARLSLKHLIVTVLLHAYRSDQFHLCLICCTCGLNFNCFIRHPHQCSNFNDIRNCASVLKYCDLITKGQQALTLFWYVAKNWLWHWAHWRWRQYRAKRFGAETENWLVIHSVV